MAKVVQSYDDELDFSDVFGGPPKRISMQDSVYSGSNDNNDDDDDNGGEDGGIRRSFWAEKPVFGDETEGRRRRYPSDDFFDDIFRGDQVSVSCSQSPARGVPLRDPYSSAPGSRIMSPTRPGVEPFGSPSKFSLPARLANTELRYNQNSQSHDLPGTDARSGYRPSPLSHQKSVDGNKSNSSSKLNKRADESGKDFKGSEIADDVSQFHFSIHKWPSKGVPLIISLRKRSSTRSKGDTEVEKQLSTDEKIESDVQVAKHIQVDKPVKDYVSSEKKEVPFTSELKNHDDIVMKETKSSSTSPPIVDEQVHIDALFSGLKDSKEMPVRSDKRLGAEVKKGPHRSSQSTRNFNVRSLSSFLQEDKEDYTVTTEKGSAKSKPKEKEKTLSNDSVSSSKVNRTKQNKSSREEKDDIRKREVPGKVKDFIKQFNQDYPSKSMKNVQGQSQSQRWKETTSFDVDHGVKRASKTSHEDIQASTVNWDRTWLEDAELIQEGEDSSVPGKQQSDINNSGGVSYTPTPTANNAADGARDPAPNIKTTDDIRRTESTDTLQDVNLQSASENKGETESYESKVLKWSKGKEGNIRALLSTLQYILWSNSGWKPVPLVDIIEANAVKRAYQRALLCLHPDKLQQKGAAAHQKLIAQNVFEILQEAWDQFNSLGHF